MPRSFKARLRNVVIVAAIAVGAVILIRGGGRMARQSEAAAGAASNRPGVPASITVTSSRIEPVVAEFSFPVGQVSIGLPAAPERVRFDPPYTRFHQRSRGMVVVTEPAPDARARDGIDEIVEIANAASVDGWTLFWTPRVELAAHIDRLKQSAELRRGSSSLEIVTGDGVKGVIHRFREGGGGTGVAIVRFERHGLVVNISAVDVENAQELLREIVARTRPIAK